MSPMDAIAAGSVFLQEGAYLPNSALLPREPHASGWAAAKRPPRTFEKDIQEAGWTCFFMAGELTATVFGWNRRRMLHAALKRLIASVKAQGCNCIEISQVANRSFLKLPYVSISAHARHFQKGLVFAGQRKTEVDRPTYWATSRPPQASAPRSGPGGRAGGFGPDVSAVDSIEIGGTAL